MSSLKIYIACHKPCEVPSDDIYTPIHVGRSQSQYSLDMIGDDTGDNISDKNSTFCEMTAQYWVWKNVHDVDYVGFCHYRRFFDKTFTNDSIKSLFSDGTDVILPKPQCRLLTMQHTLLLYVSPDDVAILRYVIHSMYPDYEAVFDNYLLGVDDYPYNMLLCNKKLFDEYSLWLFNILFECEKYIKLSPYSRGRRVFGYIAEFLMPIYFIKNGYKIKCLEVAFKSENGILEVQKVRWQDKIKGFIVKKWSHIINKRPYMYDRAHIIALSSDGIPINSV